MTPASSSAPNALDRFSTITGARPIFLVGDPAVREGGWSNTLITDRGTARQLLAGQRTAAEPA